MEPGFFLRGLLIGFSIAAPVGPIGVLCIRRTLVDGRLAGLVSGLGAATADAFYGSLAGFGLTQTSWSASRPGCALPVVSSCSTWASRPSSVNQPRMPRKLPTQVPEGYGALICRPCCSP